MSEVIQVSDTEEYFAEDRDQVYCLHGKYIGYPGGVDFICPYCEDGADILAWSLRYNIDVNFRPELEDEDDFVTIIRCWGEADLRKNLTSLHFLFGAALKGSTQVRIVVIRYPFWTNIEPQEETPVVYLPFEEVVNE